MLAFGIIIGTFSAIQPQEKLVEYPGRRKQKPPGFLSYHHPLRSYKSQPTEKEVLVKKVGVH